MDFFVKVDMMAVSIEFPFQIFYSRFGIMIAQYITRTPMNYRRDGDKT